MMGVPLSGPPYIYGDNMSAIHNKAELLWLEDLGFFLAGGSIATSSSEPELLSAPAFFLTTADMITWMECLDKVVLAAALPLGLWFSMVENVLSLAPLLWPCTPFMEDLLLHICPDILCLYWCFINMTLIFGVIAIFGPMLLLFGNRRHYSERDIRYCNFPLLFICIKYITTTFIHHSLYFFSFVQGQVRVGPSLAECHECVSV